jgi:hypothetical protein
MTVSNWFGINVGANAAPFIYDLNGDGLNDIIIGTRTGSIYYYQNFGTATSPYFTTTPDSVNMALGNIHVYDHTVAGPPPGYATPFITVENGQKVLYTGSQVGRIFKFAINPDSLMKGTFASLDTDVLGTKPGLRSTVYVADINHDGMNDYLCGNIRGGINLYSDANWGNVPVISSITEPTLNQNFMQVYPNPAKDQVICRLSNNSLTLVSVQLYDMLGETVNVPVNKSGDNALILSVSDVSNGIYVIQAIDSHGQLYKNKISIFK